MSFRRFIALLAFTPCIACSNSPNTVEPGRSPGTSSLVALSNAVWDLPQLRDNRGVLSTRRLIPPAELPIDDATDAIGALHGADGMRAVFPVTLAQSVHLAHKAVAIDIKRMGAPQTRLAKSGGYLIAADTDVSTIVRPIADGFEDYLYFAFAPPVPSVQYVVHLDRVAGVRFVSDVVEFLDASGSPQLRVVAPTIYDADGPHSIETSVEDCLYDSSPAPPWDRAVTDPRSAQCRITFRWNTQAYPAVFDPAWTSTAGLAHARFYHASSSTATRMLVSGGFDSSGNAMTSAELSNGVTWVVTGNLNVARGNHGAQFMSTTNRHLAAGGRAVYGGSPAPALNTSEEWDPVSGAWTLSSGNMSSGVYAFSIGTVNSKPIIAGGWQPGNATDKLETYDPTTHTWTLLGATLAQARAYSGFAVLPTPPAPNMFVVMGGEYLAGLISPVNNTDVYDGTSNTIWSATPVPIARSHLAAAALSGVANHTHPWIVMAGGTEGFSTYDDIAVFDMTGVASLPISAVGSWSTSVLPTNHMTEQRQDHTTTLVNVPSKNQVMIAGGFHWSGGTATVDTTSDEGDFSAVAPPYAWQAKNLPLITPRWAHTSHVIGNKVYLIGGYGTSGPLSAVEKY